MSALPWFFAFDHLPEGVEGRDRAMGDGAFASMTDNDFNVVENETTLGRRVWRRRTAASQAGEKAVAAGTEFTVGFRFAINANQTAFLEFMVGASTKLAMRITSDKLDVVRGSTVLATGPTTVTDLVWRYCEIAVKMHDTDGSVEVRLDGVLELSVSDVDTSNVAGDVNLIRFGKPSGDTWTWCFLTDLYIRAGLAFYGPIVLHPLYPASDHDVEWTPDSGSNNYDRVNNDSDASYIESDTLGETDEYTLDDLPAGVNSIIALVPVTVGFAPDGGAPAVNLSVRDADGVIAEGPDRVLGVTGLRSQTGVLLTRDAGGPWTPAQVNGSRLLIESV